MAGEVKENNVDLGSAAADFAAATAIGVAAKGLEMAKAKATLYVRMLGENNDTTGATTNQDVAALKDKDPEEKGQEGRTARGG